MTGDREVSLPVDELLAMSEATVALIRRLRELPDDLTARLLDHGVGELVGQVNDTHAALATTIKARRA